MFCLPFHDQGDPLLLGHPLRQEGDPARRQVVDQVRLEGVGPVPRWVQDLVRPGSLEEQMSARTKMTRMTIPVL